MYKIDLQIAVDDTDGIPSQELMCKYAEEAGKGIRENAQITIRIVTEEESHELDLEYRHKDRPTNVLSFPYELPEDLPPEALKEIPQDLIGDLVICKNVVEREAAEQKITTEAHWAHMIVHGTLHLLGYDHVKPEDAAIMEPLESKIMVRLGFQDPYLSEKE